MVESAGVDVNPPNSFAPRHHERLPQEPPPVPVPRQLRQDPQERDLALAGFAKVELDHADLGPDVVDDDIKLDRAVLDDSGELLVAHDEAGEPQPGLADSTEELAIGVDVGILDSAQRVC